MKVSKCFKENKNENGTYRNWWDAAKAVLRGKLLWAGLAAKVLEVSALQVFDIPKFKTLLVISREGFFVVGHTFPFVKPLDI